MQISRQIKIDGALGAMTTEGQPTHSIYPVIIANVVKNVNVARIENDGAEMMSRFAHYFFVINARDLESEVN